jgi:hypothetical protein
VAIVMGKKQKSTTIIIFGAMPNPNQRSSSGARIIKGIVWEITSRGYIVRLIKGNKVKRKEKVRPIIIARMKPMIVSQTV